MGLFGRILDLLFPPKCVFCGKVMNDPGEGVCPVCMKELPWSDGRPRKADFVSRITAPLYYEGTVRDSFLRYKFHAASARGAVYGRLVGAELLRREAADFDVLTWAPLNRYRKRRRGYDQAQLIAESAAAELGTTAVPVLEKIRNAPPQSGLRTPEKRRANVSGCYIVPDPGLVADKRVLIVDDVITTGATVSECARMLMLAGARDVCAASLAVRRNEKRPLEPYEVTDI